MTASPHVLDKRRAGVLLHITSLPSRMGNGTIGGQEVLDFIEFLSDCGLSVWQVLPIHPLQDSAPTRTPYRNFLSPYYPQSVHAGNPLLINIQNLINRGWLSPRQLPLSRYKKIEEYFPYRYKCLEDSYWHFFKHATAREQALYEKFYDENSYWLNDYALFYALKEVYQGACWWNWPNKNYRGYESEALDKARNRLSNKIEKYCFIQFAFFTQWQELKKYAHQKGVYIFGDMPYFVARDSVDVWAHQKFFLLDKQSSPKYISGVPPQYDYFYPNGKLWGHPVYDWNQLQADGFQWWAERFTTVNQLFDLTQLSYFHGFYKYWKSDVTNCCPEKGEWEKPPIEELFLKIREKNLKNLLLMSVEDIDILNKMVQLRKDFGFFGMKILQLAFDLTEESQLKNYHLPHHHSPHNVVYTGTQDSNTTLGWLKVIENKEGDRLKFICDYLNTSPDNVPRSLIRAAFGSVAKLAIIPMQDLLFLDSEHRMNNPNARSNKRNWRWQYESCQITRNLKMDLKKLVERYDR